MFVFPFLFRYAKFVVFLCRIEHSLSFLAWYDRSTFACNDGQDVFEKPTRPRGAQFQFDGRFTRLRLKPAG